MNWRRCWSIVGVVTEIVIQNVSIAVLGLPENWFYCLCYAFRLMLSLIHHSIISDTPLTTLHTLSITHTHSCTPNQQLTTQKASWIPMTNKNQFLLSWHEPQQNIGPCSEEIETTTRSEPRTWFVHVVFGDDRNITPTLSVGVVYLQIRFYHFYEQLQWDAISIHTPSMPAEREGVPTLIAPYCIYGTHTLVLRQSWLSGYECPWLK